MCLSLLSLDLVSIRAYGMQDTFIQEAFVRTNKYTRTARPFNDLSLWFSARLLVLGAGFSSSLAGYLLYSRTTGPGNMGFSLEMAGRFLFSDIFQGLSVCHQLGSQRASFG